MGVDARIEDLPESVNSTELETLKATLKIAIDDPSFSASDAKKMLLSTFLTSSAFNDDTLNDFQALTPKGLKANTATTTRKGVARLSTDAELRAFEGSNIIPANKLDLILNKLAEVTEYTIADKDTFIFSVTGGGVVQGFNASFREIGTIRYWRGSIIILFLGSVSSFDLAFKNIGIPSSEIAASVGMSNRTIVACASMQPVDGYINRLKVNMSKSAMLVELTFNMIY